MKYQATFISSEEFEILADEPPEYFKLYAFLRSRMNIKTKISGVESRFNTQAFREVLSVPDRRGRHKKHESESAKITPRSIQQKLDYLVKIGLIRRQKNYVFEHLLPIIPKQRISPIKTMSERRVNDECMMSERMSERKNSPQPLDSLASSKMSERMSERRVNDECMMSGTPHRYQISDINLDIDKSMSCSKPAVSERKKVNSLIKTKFEEFWSLYPRKVGKKKCESKFESLVRQKIEFADEIISGLSSQVENLKSKEVEYIPHPITWLNQGRWEDEIPEKEDWRL